MRANDQMIIFISIAAKIWWSRNTRRTSLHTRAGLIWVMLVANIAVQLLVKGRGIVSSFLKKYLRQKPHAGDHRRTLACTLLSYYGCHINSNSDPNCNKKTRAVMLILDQLHLLSQSDAILARGCFEVVRLMASCAGTGGNPFAKHRSVAMAACGCCVRFSLYKTALVIHYMQ